jgi:Na+-translocating ferredoxin:NAD+ oxidoreductase subunit B
MAVQEPRALVEHIDALLPQTQCTKCGYAGCRPYAEAILDGTADINQCPPGGHSGIEKLAALLQRPVVPLNPAHGSERDVGVAVIDESHCIGCTLCIDACPVDAIVGAPKRMHTVVASACTGCDLCVPPCPTDCIRVVVLQPGRRWTADDAQAARSRYTLREARLAQRDGHGHPRRVADPGVGVSAGADSGRERRRSVIAAAIERARSRRRQAVQR